MPNRLRGGACLAGLSPSRPPKAYPGSSSTSGSPLIPTLIFSFFFPFRLPRPRGVDTQRTAREGNQ